MGFHFAFYATSGAKIVKKAQHKIFIRFFACLVIILSSMAFGADQDRFQTIEMLQPQGLRHTGIYALRQIDQDLTGAGVKFGVICRSMTYIDNEPQNDFRPDIRHNCFQTSDLTFLPPESQIIGISPHSTAICSILFGEDPKAFHPAIGPFYYEGVVPRAQGEIHELWNFVLKHVYTQEPPNADILTASFGIEFEYPWTRGIELLAEFYGTIVVASIGNGADSHNPVLYPAAGANIIGVGVVDSVNTEDLVTNLAHFALAYPEHSSPGPTSNGRCKPDLVAPGNCLAAKINEPNLYEPTGDWSSYSTPIVAGAVGLLVQKAKENPDLSLAISPDGGNCVIKAILMNSATKLPFWHKGWLTTDDDNSAPLDYVQGAGMLNAVGAFEHLIAGLYGPGDVPPTGWDLNLLDKTDTPEQTYEFTILEPARSYITATLVWNRHYNTTFPFEPAPEKDSNLRIELWGVDPDNHDNDRRLDYSDSRSDNVEHIHFAADPNYINYKIALQFSEDENQETSAVSQRYGLAWNVREAEQTDNIFWYDLNADGIVDDLDFTIILNNLTENTRSNENYVLGDIKPDGAINSEDVEALFQEIRNGRRADWHSKIENKPG